MNNPEEQQIALIPRNFIERGTFMGGMFKIRNAIEGAILAIGIAIPVVHLPLSLTIRIIILCMTSLPAAMVALIGIGGESLTAFLMNAVRFLFNRRILYRLDTKPEPKGKQRKNPRQKEPKTKKNREKKEKPSPQPMEIATHDEEVPCNMPSSSEEEILPDSKVSPTPASKKKERRLYDISTKRGIKKQAREDIRILKFEKKQRKKEQAKALKVAKREKKQRLKTEKQRHKEKLHQDKLAQKEAKRLEKAAKKEARSNKKQPDPSPSVSSKKKKRKDMTLEDYLPIDKIANGIIYTTDHRYVKILEIEPINFLLRSAREQQGIIYSFISYLKISPVKLQIKMISKKADINKHLEQAALELSRETNPHCRELQKDYIQFVKKLSSREAVSRRFFLIFEYEPFNVNRKVEEKEILAALETAAQTAKTFLYQCGNQVVTHDNEDEFTTDVLYTLLNRTLCTEKPLQDRIADVLARYMKEGRQEELDHIRINEFIAPESVDFRHSNYVRINGIYHAYLLVPSDGYKQKVAPGWLSLLINAGEGIDIDFYLHKQPKDKIQQRLGQQIRINRSKIKDASDTNADFDDLDSAIRSGYFLKAGLANNEDFYYINLLITITASDLEELQWRIQEMKKLLISQDMDLHSCYFLQEQGFLSSLPLANLDKKLYELSKRNVLTTGAASCYPFTSYSICDDNGILFGVNKHNNSLVIADIFDSKQYKNSNICILGCSGAGKTFTMQTMALRMRRKGIQVFIIAPLKGHEFYRACKNVGGEFIQISPASQNCINVMEIRKVDNSVNELLDGPTLDASALASKIQRLHIFFSLLIPDMNHEEKQLLDEALIKTYARKGITHKNESLIDPVHPNQYKEMPILEDVYNILMESPDTKRLAHILNRLVHGSASSFNQKTNVDLTNKYTVLDISELTGSSDLLTVGMFVALDYVWDKAKENRTEEKAIFVDEVWQLIGASSNRLAAEFVLEIAKIIRAYSGAGIFATQDLNDFFALDDGKYGKGIINNCKTKIILNMEDEEAQRVKNILHLSETEVMNITHFQRGNGLISTNNNNITVEFKASTLEKELITTDRQELLEIIERQKHKEAKAG
ncbi:MAG: ATP-binding protein [Faecalicatena sp.]|uniref:TraG/VirB4 family ATPase n=1 Tax=Faecalicatena sp. TaxID=2005360 RepID=UPI002587B388|nr:ATP-binding protein [Faecalicatena sp.]MCI6465158.1 ATP-binding protein [Faecalicatena sp.]MDY5617041.1 ATP-binding protein [Lachnospiraceae bacterium]